MHIDQNDWQIKEFCSKGYTESLGAILKTKPEGCICEAENAACIFRHRQRPGEKKLVTKKVPMTKVGETHRVNVLLEHGFDSTELLATPIQSDLLLG